MICKFCSKEIADDAKVCEFCGQAVDAAENVKEEPVQEEPKEEPKEEPVQEEPKVEPEVIVKPKKKKGAFVVLGIVAVILVAAIIAVTCFADTLKGMFMKTFASDEDYFRYVTEKSVTAFTDNLSKGYGNFVEKASSGETGNSSKMSVKLNVGDTALNMLEQAIGAEIDLNWLKNISFDMDVNTEDNVSQLLAAININGKKLVDADVIADMNNNDLFVGLLSLSEKYLKVDMEPMDSNAGNAYVQGNTYAQDAINSVVFEILNDEEFVKALPTEKEFNEILTGYVKVIINAIEKVEKTTEKVTVDGVTEELTVINIQIDHEDFLKIVTAVLEEVKTDEDFKAYMTDFLKYLEKKGYADNPDGWVKEFYDLVDQAIAEIKETEIEEGILYITQYVDSLSDVVGVKLGFDDDEIISSIEVHDGDAFAKEIEIGGLITVKGKGTEKKDVINAEYKLVVEGETYIEVTAKDFYTDEEDELRGKLYFAPTASLYELMGMDSSTVTALSIAKLELELGFDMNEKSARVDVNVLSGGNIFVGVTVSGEETKAEDIKLPSDQVVCDESKVMEWAASLDFSKIAENAKNAGVPDEIVELVSSMFSGSSNNNVPSYQYGETDFNASTQFAY